MALDHTGDVGQIGRAQTRPGLSALSVRSRLVAVILLVSALGVLGVGAASYSVERQRILAQVDDLLVTHLDAARFIVDEGPATTPPTDWDSSAAALRDVVKRMSPDDNTGAAGIVDGRIALVPGIPLDVDLVDADAFVARVVAETADGEAVIGTFAEDGVAWRYLATPITAGSTPGPPAVFTMVYDLRAEIEELNLVARVYLISSAVALIVIAVVSWLVAGRLLRPLREMRRTAELVSARSLSERIPVQGNDDVSELARTINDMLDRLDDAVDSQRQLVSDVGHELKTPITIVRGYLDVMDADDPADVRETSELVVDELDRMASLVQDLANAAALHGPSPIRLEPTDTADHVQQILRKAEGIEGATVRAGRIADVVADLDPARITQAMLQLAQNAVTHGGGDLVIGSRVVDDRLELWVRDHGRGVPDAAKSRIFQRFERLDRGDGSETEQDVAGNGLGLHIVQVIARAHGGEVRVIDAADGPGAIFVIAVPLHPDHAERAVPRGDLAVAARALGTED